MSKNAMAMYEGAKANLVAYLESMETSVAAMTGCPLPQAKAVTMVCMCEGISYLDYLRTYHTIQGKPSLRADAALAKFRAEWGGDYTILESSPEKASIEFERGGKKFTKTITWEEAQAARWPWKDPSNKSKGFKDNWSTPSDVESMLWARCVTNGLKRFCPEVNYGLYSPEENEDIYGAAMESMPATPPKSALDLAREASTNPAATVVSATVVTPPGQTATPTLPDDCEVEAEFEEGDASFEPAVLEKGKEPVTERQMGLLADLIGRCGLSQDAVDKMLAKPGREVKVLAELNRAQAHEIIDRLQAKLLDADPTYKPQYDEDEPAIPFGK